MPTSDRSDRKIFKDHVLAIQINSESLLLPKYISHVFHWKLYS